MEVVICESPEEVGRRGAALVANQVRRDPRSVLGVATGSSPVATYRELGRLVADGQLSLAGCTAFMLDEYIGLPVEHPQRYRTFIERELVDITDLRSENVHGPDVLGEDLGAACASYEAAIQGAGGVDLQILGIGTDGHIAFNEPGSSLASRTRIKTLTRQTRHDNAHFFGGDMSQVPRHCMTQGIGTILDSRQVLLVATGDGKAEAVHQMVEGPVSAMWPATALQLHPHVIVLVDDAAASSLQLRGYYEDVWAGKPGWQKW